jgi:hypothetical protein
MHSSWFFHDALDQQGRDFMGKKVELGMGLLGTSAGIGGRRVVRSNAALRTVSLASDASSSDARLARTRLPEPRRQIQFPVTFPSCDAARIQPLLNYCTSEPPHESRYQRHGPHGRLALRAAFGAIEREAIDPRGGNRLRWCT